MELSMIYGNNKTGTTRTGEYISVQISENSFINIPTAIRNEQLQNEYLISNIGIKYGLMQNLDISLKANLLYNSNRFIDIESSNKSQHDTNISDISLGTNYQFIEDNKYPALVGFIETAIFEKGQNRNSIFSSWSAGLTTYRSYDPIVLSLTYGYKYTLKRKVEDKITYKMADLFFMNPQIAFAANDNISLISGLNFKYQGNQKINNRIVQKKRNNLDYSFGIGYGINDSSNLNLVTTIRQDFDNSNEVRLNYIKKF
ncbi:hypothetical protein [Acinetobacter bereziniae]|nr:hypothetical protein [Acinetobacter bereziniae]TNL51605.1 hypothetical protein EYB59_07710 [Acinetobacter bereziniae]TNL64401.1 hypothetical protein EYY58_01345 [Acinetobacter bereziniae]